MKVSVNKGFINKTAVVKFPSPFAVGFENQDATPDEIAYLIKHYGYAISCCLRGLCREDIEMIEAKRQEAFQARRTSGDETQGTQPSGLAYQPLGLKVGATYRAERFFLEAGYIGVDVDGGMRVEEALQDEFICTQASLLYTTANHTIHQHRFRILFELPEPVRDASEYRELVTAFIRRFGGDEQCKDAARLFYGSKGATVMKVFGKVISEAELRRCKQRSSKPSAVGGEKEDREKDKSERGSRVEGEKDGREKASAGLENSSLSGLLKFAEEGKAQGQRNNGAFWLACRLVEEDNHVGIRAGSGVGSGDAARQILNRYGASCRPQMEDYELESVWQSALRHARPAAVGQKQSGICAADSNCVIKKESNAGSGEAGGGEFHREVQMEAETERAAASLNHTRYSAGAVRLAERRVPEVLRKMMDYYSQQTDAPREFLYTALLTTLAAVIGNRVSLRLGAAVIKPNLFAVILAGSSLCRKSTALGIAQQLLERVEKERAKVSPFDEQFTGAGKILYPNSGSTEGLIDMMRERRSGEEGSAQHSGLAIHSEFSSLLEECRKDYNHGMKEFFMCVYDGRRFLRRLKHEESMIENPCLSLIGASTMEQFERKITEEDKYSGFLQRFVFCYLPTASVKPRSLVELHEPDERQEAAMAEWLTKVSAVAALIERKRVRMVLSREAAEAYQKSFDEDAEEVARLESEAADKAGAAGSFYARLDVVKFKIALLYAVMKVAEMPVSAVEEMFSTSSGAECRVEITGELMTAAIEAVRFFQGTVRHLLVKEFAFGHSQQRQKRVMELLQKHRGELANRKLLHATGWSAKEYNEVIRTLEEQGRIEAATTRSISGQEMRIVRIVECEQ